MSKCIYCEENEATLFRPFHSNIDGTTKPIACQECKDNGLIKKDE